MATAVLTEAEREEALRRRWRSAGVFVFWLLVALGVTMSGHLPEDS
ncbi:hypothetical protein Lesp02_60220 [Lentzea sp. NBRC 105346]|nr:hypothetical protein [Lentzea sp. NBRC 105346]GLZ33834.1 hypothetical protein Lesp02_60220 [Lentzea sp. NBRC 105346]